MEIKEQNIMASLGFGRSRENMLVCCSDACTYVIPKAVRFERSPGKEMTHSIPGHDKSYLIPLAVGPADVMIFGNVSDKQRCYMTSLSMKASECRSLIVL